MNQLTISLGNAPYDPWYPDIRSEDAPEEHGAYDRAAEENLL